MFPIEKEKAKEKNNEKELVIERYSPEEEQSDPVSKVSITFSLPMVELSSVDDAMQKAQGVVKVEPDISSYGRWMWLGTQVSNKYSNQQLFF